MALAISYAVANKARRTGTSSNGQRRWYVDYFGKLVNKVEDRPQSHYTEMDANGVIVPHFHQVNQYQIMVSGSGSIGRHALPLVGLHYADRHTAYGPINAGAQGLGLFTIRAQSDPGAIYLHQPGYKEQLKPSKQRYLIADNIAVSTDGVLQSRSETVLESVFAQDVDLGDGLGAYLLRMGAGAKTTGPDPRVTGGQYYLVLNGSLILDNADYALWSLIYVARTDAPLSVNAGPNGLEALVLNLPRVEASLA
jgi:hypothetical protein